MVLCIQLEEIGIESRFFTFSFHYQFRAYNAVLVTGLVLTVLHALSSFVLILAAERNMKNLHLPWILVHPSLTTALLVLLGILAGSFGRDIYSRYAVATIFAMFVIFWILVYMWVVVVGNYQRLGRTRTQDIAQLLEKRQSKEYLGYSKRYALDSTMGMSKGSWAAPPPPRGPSPPPPALYNEYRGPI
ncbi:unnamed protein product [Darwinula stevensoni]|uniref:Uncharacterized protein n=1 Tax=Darwinula stevensoni TaxID=69355 RepID=A0A7R9AFW9_9CRUS|nr:unnamed protein product [Darwinula stevensoni]CAG0903662.1 unnamed protein product [Darwinula stevensoni]